MEANRKIVIGVDGSDCSARALDWALAEGVRRGCDVEVVAAWMPGLAVEPIGVPTHEDPGLAEMRAKEILEEMVESASRRAVDGRVPTVARTLERGSAAEVLGRRAAGASLLVVGSHGFGAVAGALFGSVSEHCVRHATTPVTVIPHLRGPSPTDGRIVVGIDGSECSYAALRWAVDEAGLRDAPLVVVHTWWLPLALDSFGGTDMLKVRQHCSEDAHELMREMTDGMVGRAERKPASVDLLAVESRPGHLLVQVGQGADLLVVGAHGRTGVRRLIGSVSRHVLHHATGPVTIVPEVEQ
jgi:nucleotide-binding universal stress UspA family protein